MKENTIYFVGGVALYGTRLSCRFILVSFALYGDHFIKLICDMCEWFSKES